MEDYKKKYEDALKKAKDLHDNHALGMPFIYETCEQIFPELKESEDENWIPKEITKYLKEKGDFRSCWIAWLERQGEQKPVENEELTEFDKAVGVSIGTWNPKTPEQIQSIKAISKKLLKIAKKQINYEQNPTAWSEEDEEMVECLNNCLDELEEVNGWCYIYVNNKDVKLNKVRNWLKSLKERHIWEPSDEQMQFLWKYAEQNNYDGAVLASLYQDLKKLREE